MSAELAEKLSRQTTDLVARFEGRVDMFGGRDDLLKLLLPVNRDSVLGFARRYFGEGEFTLPSALQAYEEFV